MSRRCGVSIRRAQSCLAGPDVYKAKRAVVFPFMDLSGAGQARLAYEAEIEDNAVQRTPSTSAASPITRSGAACAIGGKARSSGGSPMRRRRGRSARRPRTGNRTRSSASWRSRSTFPRAPLGMPRARHALETYIEQNSAAFAESGPIFRRRDRRRLTVDARLAFAIGDRSCSSAARPDSSAGTSWRSTCATSSSSTFEPTRIQARWSPR